MAVDPDLLERLRREGWKVTPARIGVLQVVQAQAPQSLSAEDVHRQMLRRGARASIGTVYRILQEFEQRNWLLREWSAQRTALYRLPPHGSANAGAPCVTLVCEHSGQRVVLEDAELCAQLLAAARRSGLAGAGISAAVRVGRGG